MEIREGDLTKLDSGFKTIKNGSFVVAWDFSPYETPFVMVAEKKNDKLFTFIKEKDCGLLVFDGYRNQSDTVREFVERLKQIRLNRIRIGEYDGIDLWLDIKKLAKEYGVEVEE